jgi:hypothetical protein
MATSFAMQVLLNNDKVISGINSKCYKIAKELFTSVVDLTPSPTNPGPFAKGELVNQWYPEAGGGFSEELSPDLSSTGAGSRARIAALHGFEFLGHDGTLTLSNNLPYAGRAESIGWPVADGWSGKIGPYRMVARSIQAVAAKYK